MKKIGIYIHIPFCKRKCYYCDFISYCNEENNIQNYIECVKKEIKYKSEQLNEFSKKNSENFIIDTIYIGGGTPSFIEDKNITNLLDNINKYFNVDQNVEITIELNPDSVNSEKLKNYQNAGINRVSIGLQSTNDKLLKKIGRIHNYEQFQTAYELVKKNGFKNINIDLMIGLPDQTLEDVESSLKEVIKLNPTHISVYSLILEEKTKLEKEVSSGILSLPSEEIERKMYWLVKETLEKENYIHYEISNFAKDGMQSKHNVNCWNQNEYLGVGIAAHSYFNSIRFSNTTDMKEYIKNIHENNFSKNQIIHEILSLEEKQKEFMLLGLRKLNGIEIKDFKNKFMQNPIYLFREQLSKLQEEDLIEIDGDFIRLTNRGLDLANIVWEEFV